MAIIEPPRAASGPVAKIALAAGAALLNEAQAGINPKGKRTCITVPFSEGDGFEAWITDYVKG